MLEVVKLLESGDIEWEVFEAAMDKVLIYLFTYLFIYLATLSGRFSRLPWTRF
jgi:hypothetical protein